MNTFDFRHFWGGTGGKKKILGVCVCFKGGTGKVPDRHRRFAVGWAGFWPGVAWMGGSGTQDLARVGGCHTESYGTAAHVCLQAFTVNINIEKAINWHFCTAAIRPICPTAVTISGN